MLPQCRLGFLLTAALISSAICLRRTDIEPRSHGSLAKAALAGNGSHSHAGKGRLAMLICGVQDRLLMASKLREVVAVNKRAGYAVDIYVDLVRSGAQANAEFWAVKNELRNLDFEGHGEPHGDFKDRLSSQIQHAGGELVHLDILSTPEDVNSSLPAPDDYQFARLTQYPPNQTPTGTNILRRYKSIEHLMNLTLAHEREVGMTYDFVLWTRDDDEWLGPLDLPRFAAEQNSSELMYSRNCLSWGGINDKTLLFGRRAAGRMLTRMYSDFLMPDKRLDYTFNAEAFLKKFALVKDVNVSQVAFGRIPTAESVYQNSTGKGVQLCQKKMYLCPDLPKGPPFQTPLVCTPGSKSPNLHFSSEDPYRPR